MSKIWACKIGEVDESELPPGADYPMRIAIKKAYREVTGRDLNFLFSGWDGDLTEIEREVAND